MLNSDGVPAVIRQSGQYVIVRRRQEGGIDTICSSTCGRRVIVKSCCGVECKRFCVISIDGAEQIIGVEHIDVESVCRHPFNTIDGMCFYSHGVGGLSGFTTIAATA